MNSSTEEIYIILCRNYYSHSKIFISIGIGGGNNYQDTCHRLSFKLCKEWIIGFPRTLFFNFLSKYFSVLHPTFLTPQTSNSPNPSTVPKYWINYSSGIFYIFTHQISDRILLNNLLLLFYPLWVLDLYRNAVFWVDILY